MRLDAVASAAMGISRTQMAKLVSSGSVCVEDVVQKSPATTVKVTSQVPGNIYVRLPHSCYCIAQLESVVTVKGLGRFIVDRISQTSKGRFKVDMRRIKYPTLPA